MKTPVSTRVSPQLSEAAAAPAGEDVDAPRGHLQKGLPVCARESRVSQTEEPSSYKAGFSMCTSDLISLRRVFSAHWYLAIICFPGLTEPTSENTGNGNDASSVAEISNGATEECQELESFQGDGRTDDKTETTPSVINRVGGNPETGRCYDSQDASAFHCTFVT